MTAQVHPTAIVDPAARLEAGVRVGPLAIVDGGVTLGANTEIAARATVTGCTRLGAECYVGIGAVLGTPPQDLKFDGEESALEVGARTRIREYTTINRGTAASGCTTIGSDCYLMSYVHVAHDCTIGDSVVLANSVQLAGHVTIDDHAQVGGSTPIHQFVRIGRYAFVGGGSRVPRDVPPYTLTAGNPMRLYGLNTEGLRRAGFDAERRYALKRAYRLLFNSHLTRSAAVEAVRTAGPITQDVEMLLDFVCRSARGVTV